MSGCISSPVTAMGPKVGPTNSKCHFNTSKASSGPSMASQTLACAEALGMALLGCANMTTERNTICTGHTLPIRLDESSSLFSPSLPNLGLLSEDASHTIQEV